MFVNEGDHLRNGRSSAARRTPDLRAAPEQNMLTPCAGSRSRCAALHLQLADLTLQRLYPCTIFGRHAIALSLP